MKRQAKKKKLPRNWYAVHAFQRSGGGNHGDKKKEASKKGEKDSQKLNADSGSKLTKVETEPKVDYKN